MHEVSRACAELRARICLKHYSLLALPTEFVGLRTRVRPGLFTIEEAAVFPWFRLTVGLRYFFRRSRLSR